MEMIGYRVSVAISEDDEQSGRLLSERPSQRDFIKSIVRSRLVE